MPEVMNAVSMEMLGGLREALDAVEDPDNGARCLVLTGEGRAFCAGANLQGRSNKQEQPPRPRLGARDGLSPDPAPAAQPADAAGHRRQRGGGRASA